MSTPFLGPSQGGTAVPPTAPPPEAAVRLMLVDSQTMLREGLALRLQAEPGFTLVAQAGEMAAAVILTAESSPDVVIVDPAVAGGGSVPLVISRLRQSHPVRILVLTGETDLDLAREALVAGAAGFLRKTDSSDELVRAIRLVMSGNIYLSPDATTVVSRAVAAGSPGSPALTARELEVLRGLADGLSHKEIAQHLGLSPKSVETYRARLARKTGCTTRAELVRYAVRRGVVRA